MNTNIRKAEVRDAGHVEQLMYSSGPEIYDFTYKRDDSTPHEYIAFEFLSGRGICGFQNVTVIEKDKEILGVVCFYTGSDYKGLTKGSLKNLFKYSGFFSGFRSLFEMRHLAGMITKPKEDELYIMNLGIRKDCQGQGLGSELIKYIISCANKHGAKKVSLDVATNNPMAEKLYSKLGFQVVHTRTPPKAIQHLPGSKKMEINL